MDICKVISHKYFVPALLSAVGFGPFVSSLFMQYVAELEPCHLCLIQRYLYLATGLVGLLGFVLLTKQKLLKAVAVTVMLLLISNAGVALYHAGVERHIIKGPEGCAGESTPGASLEELRKQIMEAEVVRCDEPATRIAGLSLSEWNMLLGLGLAALVFVFAIRRKCDQAAV